MTRQPRKMSEILKEMFERLLRNPDRVPSEEAASIALMFANIAWNEAVGVGHPRGEFGAPWQSIAAENTGVWSELISADPDALIDQLVQFKKRRCPRDRRRILSCGIINGKVRVEWVPAAAPGVDARWELTLFGLVRTGAREKAIRFLQDTRGMSRDDAANKVLAIAADFLGVR